MTDCPATTGQHSRATDYSNHGCRCDAARADRERHRKQRHLQPPARVPANGARLRLRALMTLGHSQNDLNALLGRKPSGSLGPLLWDAERQTVTRDMHERIVAVYERLWRTPGTGPRATFVRERALKNGWATPLELDDDRLDDPAYVPQLARRTPLIDRRERRLQIIATVAHLTERGTPTEQIARHIGATPRSVQRYRKALRAAS